MDNFVAARLAQMLWSLEHPVTTTDVVCKALSNILNFRPDAVGQAIDSGIVEAVWRLLTWNQITVDCAGSTVTLFGKLLYAYGIQNFRVDQVT
jgi:hypothetical protein